MASSTAGGKCARLRLSPDEDEPDVADVDVGS
jgi:hypothetical protein